MTSATVPSRRRVTVRSAISLLLQRAQVVLESIGTAGVLFEVFGERHAVLRRALEQLHFRAAQVIRPALIAYRFSISSLGQRKTVPAVAVDLFTRSRRDAVAERRHLQVVIAACRVRAFNTVRRCSLG
jgi:hypothetical protein